MTASNRATNNTFLSESLPVTHMLYLQAFWGVCHKSEIALQLTPPENPTLEADETPDSSPQIFVLFN